MQPAIRVENLGKRYRLQHADGPRAYKTFRESLSGLATAPLRRLRSGGAAGGKAEDFWALKDVSFDVQPGEVVGIIGRNGAGKSTLLKILSRITKPTSGRVQLRGRVGSLLEVGTGFHPELTGRENVFLNGSILGMGRSEIARRFDEIVAFAGVEKFLDTPVKRYSSGMYVRLAFSVAAHLEPEILLVDEVLAVGDAAFQKRCIGRMSTIAKTGRTIFFVTHQLPMVTHLCGKACWLDGGKVREFGDAQQVVDAHLKNQMVTPAGAEYEALGARQFSSSHGTTKAIRILDSAGTPTSSIALGDRFIIRLELSEMQSRSGLNVALTFRDMHGASVARACSYTQSNLDLCLPGHQTVDCTLDDFRLLPGEYWIDLAVGDGNDWFERIDEAVKLSVESRDLYGTGRLPSRRDGFIALNAGWNSTRVPQ